MRFTTNVSFGREHVFLDDGGNVVGQDLPQPGEEFLLARSTELAEVCARAQHRFLNHIGLADATLEFPANLSCGQYGQIVAIMF